MQKSVKMLKTSANCCDGRDHPALTLLYGVISEVYETDPDLAERMTLIASTLKQDITPAIFNYIIQHLGPESIFEIVSLIALESRAEGYQPGTPEFLKFRSRRAYHYLKEYGVRKITVNGKTINAINKYVNLNEEVDYEAN